MSAYVIVNEARINAEGSGASWWFWYRSQAERSLKPFFVLNSTLVGDVVLVERDSIDDANWIADYMVGQGVPRSAMRVTERVPRSAA